MNNKKIAVKTLPLLLGICFLGLWELIIPALHIPVWILPPPSLIGSELFSSQSLIFSNLIPTVTEACIGLFIAVILALGLAILLEWSKLLKDILYPYLVLTQTIPTIALAPLLAIWFGFGMLSKIIVIVLVCFFPITVSTLDGFGQTSENSIKFLKTINATPFQIFRYCKLPYCLPSFFAGLRIAVTYSVLGAVISEWFGGNMGLGILLVRSAKSYLTARVFAIVVVIALLTLVAVWLVDCISAKLLPWNSKKISS